MKTVKIATNLITFSNAEALFARSRDHRQNVVSFVAVRFMNIGMLYELRESLLLSLIIAFTAMTLLKSTNLNIYYAEEKIIAARREWLGKQLKT